MHADDVFSAGADDVGVDHCGWLSGGATISCRWSYLGQRLRQATGPEPTRDSTLLGQSSLITNSTDKFVPFLKSLNRLVHFDAKRKFLGKSNSFDILSGRFMAWIPKRIDVSGQIRTAIVPTCNDMGTYTLLITRRGVHDDPNIYPFFANVWNDSVFD